MPPDPVVVVQVSDEGKARTALGRLASCGDGPADVAYDVHDGWAVFAGDQGAVEKVVSETEHASLADDATYQKWTKAVGDAGVVNAYASPAAGRVLAEQLSGLFEGALSGASESFTTSSTTTMTATGSGSAATRDDPFSKALSSFKGGAATLRFTGDGLEFAMAVEHW